jgi:hypothetical protein
MNLFLKSGFKRWILNSEACGFDSNADRRSVSKCHNLFFLELAPSAFRIPLQLETPNRVSTRPQTSLHLRLFFSEIYHSPQRRQRRGQLSRPFAPSSYGHPPWRNRRSLSSSAANRSGVPDLILPFPKCFQNFAKLKGCPQL